MVQTCVVPQVLAIVLNATVTVIVRQEVAALQVKPSSAPIKMKTEYAYRMFAAKQVEQVIVCNETVKVIVYRQVAALAL